MENKCLVIPDLHLKPWIVRSSIKLMEKMNLGVAVFLGDGADDWNKEDDIALYNETYYYIMKFMEKFPDSLFCYGNHEAAYLWRKRETSGYSTHSEMVVWSALLDMKRKMGQRLAFVHKIQNTFFSHAPIVAPFVRRLGLEEDASNDELIKKINDLGPEILWAADSPIWIRPDSEKFIPYLDMFQVTGHTPVAKPVMVDNKVLLCDLFSTNTTGKPIGSQDFIIVDTKEQTWETMKCIF